MTVSESIIVQWTGGDHVPRRLRLEPVADGEWRRVEQRHNGCEWVTAGSETVADVRLDALGVHVHDDAAIVE
jgi:hypothetical protein